MTTSNTHTPNSDARRHAQEAAGTLFSAALRALRTALEHFRSRRRLAQMHATLAALDEATLRDIGLGRSEAGSYWAESEGQIEATRVRVISQRVGGGW